MKTYKGQFKPKNPHKYIGNLSNIIYRSGWELKYMIYLDNHPDILQWNSEEIVIPYRSPVDGMMHRYFPDFLVKTKDVTMIIEIKPKKQTIPPKKPKKVSRQYLNEVMTWGVNEAKWKAAQEYCKDRLWQFRVFTEDHLGIKT
jgi:hypothetical protein